MGLIKGGTRSLDYSSYILIYNIRHRIICYNMVYNGDDTESPRGVFKGCIGVVLRNYVGNI